MTAIEIKTPAHITDFELQVGLAKVNFLRKHGWEFFVLLGKFEMYKKVYNGEAITACLEQAMEIEHHIWLRR